MLKKIVRRRADKKEKYSAIDVDMYHSIVTDLIGLRALHLFKGDCFAIDKDISSVWTPTERIAYIRMGDQGEHSEKLEAGGFAIAPHEHECAEST